MTELDKLQFIADIYALFPKYIDSLADFLDAADTLTNIAEGLRMHGIATQENKTSRSVVYINAKDNTGVWEVEPVLTIE